MTIRPESLSIGMRTLSLPIYFPSISSIKTTSCPLNYLKLLSSLSEINTQFLLSAFDLSNIDQSMAVQQALASAHQMNIVTLMDSGNYESYWTNTQQDWKQSDFHRMLAKFPCDLAFSFDEQEPPTDTNEHVSLIAERWKSDQQAAGNCQIIPIIHGVANELPALCTAVANKTGVKILAVPERRLGDGILERSRTLMAIRKALNELGRYIALHLLGTGNPTAIALYSAIGADSFDGLEWCQTVVDHESCLLYHFSQADFFAGQTVWGEDSTLPFQMRTLLHNLEFFSDWMRRLHDAMKQEKLAEFCRSNISPRAYHHIANITGWNHP